MFILLLDGMFDLNEIGLFLKRPSMKLSTCALFNIGRPFLTRNGLEGAVRQTSRDRQKLLVNLEKKFHIFKFFEKKLQKNSNLLDW